MSVKRLVNNMSIETNDFEISGMHCAACVSRIEKVVANTDGVIDINVNLATEKGRVSYDKQRTNIATILHNVNKIGFKTMNIAANSSVKNQEKQKELQLLKWKLLISSLLTFPLAWAMFTHFSWLDSIYIPSLFHHAFFQLALTIPIQFIIGYSFYYNAWYALKSGSANMDVLVVLSTSAAFFYSHYLTFPTPIEEPVVLYYETSAFIITCILLGRFLEAKTKSKTTEALQQLYALQTKTATQAINGKERQLPMEQILPGHIIIVKPGEKVPIDGQVISGKSLINESLLTGESIPIHKEYGNMVYAGTMNHHGVLHIKATKRNTETALRSEEHTSELQS